MGINKRTKHIQFAFVDSGFASSLATCSSSCFNREQPNKCFHQNTSSCSSSTTSSRRWSSNQCCQRSLEHNNIFLVVDNIKKQKQLQVALCQQLRPQQAPQVVQLRSATATGQQKQRNGQQSSILQLSGGTSPTTLDNWQQVDQHQSAGSNLQQQQQEQQTTCDGQLFVHNELFMIQHQADSSEQPRDPPPISATTRSEFQRSSLEIIAEALNRQQQRRGRRHLSHLSPQPILTPLSTSSVGEMHQSQRGNDDNHDRREATTRTTKEEEERQQPRQRRRQQQDIKMEEGSKDNKKEDIKRETTTTKKKEETTKKEERKVKEEEEGKGEEDSQRQRQPSSQRRTWATATIMTATLFFSISFSLFINWFNKREGRGN